MQQQELYYCQQRLSMSGSQSRKPTIILINKKPVHQMSQKHITPNIYSPQGNPPIDKEQPRKDEGLKNSGSKNNQQKEIQDRDNTQSKHIPTILKQSRTHQSKQQQNHINIPATNPNIPATHTNIPAPHTKKPKIIKKQETKQTQVQFKQIPSIQWEETKVEYEKEKKIPKSQLKHAFEISNKNNGGEVQASLNLSCSICEGSMAKNVIISIPVCGHTLHKQCLESYVELKMSPPYQRIRCPFGDCQNDLKQNYLRQHLSSALLEKYWEYQSNIELMVLVKEKYIKLCPQKGCRQMVFTKNFGKIPHYTCRTTQRQICKNCNMLYHWRIPNCEQFIKSHDKNSTEYQYLKLAKEKNWMQCAKCLNMIQKNEGCVHIKCACGYDFCYKCGGPFPQCHCPSKQSKSLIWHQELEI